MRPVTLLPVLFAAAVLSKPWEDLPEKETVCIEVYEHVLLKGSSEEICLDDSGSCHDLLGTNWAKRISSVDTRGKAIIAYSEPQCAGSKMLRLGPITTSKEFDDNGWNDAVVSLRYDQRSPACETFIKTVSYGRMIRFSHNRPSRKQCKWTLEANAVGSGLAVELLSIKSCDTAVVLVYSKNSPLDDFVLYESDPQTNSFTAESGVIGLYIDTGGCANTELLASVTEEPIQWTISDSVKNTTHQELVCLNGGESSSPADAGKPCNCPPGFAGLDCSTACGPDRYGDDCKETCSGRERGCQGKQFCRFHSRCTCAAGLYGPDCEQVCASGYYGAGCTQHCGNCQVDGECDPYTGYCVAGCKEGYLLPNCHQVLKHLLEAPNITLISDTSFGGSVVVNSQVTLGKGTVDTIEVQYQTVLGKRWLTGIVERFDEGAPFVFEVDGLLPATEYYVRVLLLTSRLQSYRAVPYVLVKTTGKRMLADLKVDNVTSRSAYLSWSSPADSKSFNVFYECQSLISCPGEDCSGSSGMMSVSDLKVPLDGLLPAAMYRVMVASDQESEEQNFATSLDVPGAVVSSMTVVHRTNTSAVVTWEPPDSCVEMNGPLSGYIWQLIKLDDATPFSINGGRTNGKRLELLGLQPLTPYEVTVNVINQDGDGEIFSSINFTTQFSVPEAPLQLVLYRVNHTTLWLRWKPPVRPNGALRRYVVEVSGAEVQQRDEVDASAHCPAWPGLVCHSVGGLRADAEYQARVAAVNEYTDDLGQWATITAKTSIAEPPPPLNLHVEPGVRSAVVRWQLPDVLHSDLLSFEVVVTPKVAAVGGVVRLQVPAPREMPEYESEITGLQPETPYAVRVRCGWDGAFAREEIATLAEPRTTTEDYTQPTLVPTAVPRM